jgi:lysophospholipase L1-like esterase
VKKIGTLVAGLLLAGGLWYINVVPGLWDIQHAGEDVDAANAERRAFHREARMATFAVDQVPPGAILFFGSSTIERMPLPFLFQGVPAINRGVGEEEAELLRARLASATSEEIWPTVSGVVLYAGSLDRTRLGASPEAVAQRVEGVVDDLVALAPQAEVLVLGLLPQRDTTRGESEDLDELNNAVARICLARGGVGFLNLNRAPLRDPLGQLAMAYSSDRFHLNADGYQVLADWVRREGGELALLLFPEPPK